VLFWAFVAIAIIGATVAIRHASKGHDVSASSVGAAVARQPEPVHSPGLPQAETVPARISVEQEPPRISPEDEEAFASRAEADVSQLREGITLAQWMDLNGRSDGWEASTDEAFFDCRTLTKTEALPSGRQITRAVYFYPPQAPTPAIFPALAGQELINKTCLLAMVRVRTPTPADQDGHALAQATQKALAKQYGASSEVKKTVYRGSGIWQDGGRWVTNSEIVSAYAPTDSRYDPADPDRGSVFVLARLPVVHEIEQSACCGLKAYRYRSIEYTQFHRAITLTGVDASLSERMEKLFDTVFQDGRGATPSEQSQQSENIRWQQSLVMVLREWFNAVKALAPAKHAAGLYAADRLLAVAEDIDASPLGRPKEPELRTALEKMGAVFDFDELGDWYVYSSNWLKEARGLDPDGKIGQMVIVISLVRGGTGFAAKEHDVFRTVIADGERVLTQGLDGSVAAQVHFMVGDAYSDIVALAGGAEPDYGDPKEYLAEADSARKKALENYRAGLAVDSTSENAKDAWLQAWHLSAGLLPTTRYVYIYD
jgi:hypothetical protein